MLLYEEHLLVPVAVVRGVSCVLDLPRQLVAELEADVVKLSFDQRREGVRVGCQPAVRDRTGHGQGGVGAYQVVSVGIECDDA